MELTFRIQSPDIYKLSEFYSLLGVLTKHDDGKGGGIYFKVKLGQRTLEIRSGEKEKEKEDPADDRSLYFALDDFEYRFDLVKKAGIAYKTIPTNTVLGYQCRLIDPDGRTVAIFKL